MPHKVSGSSAMRSDSDPNRGANAPLTMPTSWGAITRLAMLARNSSSATDPIARRNEARQLSYRQNLRNHASRGDANSRTCSQLVNFQGFLSTRRGSGIVNCDLNNSAKP
jgi:hypothetical protein